MVRYFFSALLLIFSVACYAQNDITNRAFGWFVPVNFAAPLVSEMESTMIKVEEGWGRAREEYTPYKPKERKYMPYLNVSLGAEIPIWSASLGNDWYLAVDIPIDFHLWLDLETSSAPVINTDYRFAYGQVKALKVFHGLRYINNLSLKLAPYSHESTHIGDELTIRRKDEKFPLTRVNVSYMYTELSACLNDPVATRNENHALKGGLMLRVPTGRNWFKIYSPDGDTSLNVSMKNVLEYYLEYEWQRAHGWATAKNITNVLSFEVRNRAKYQYPTIFWDNKEDDWYSRSPKHSRAFCFNLYYGWRFFPKYLWIYNNVGFYIHGYYGIVPYGQFRNTGDYSYLGVSIVMGK